MVKGKQDYTSKKALPLLDTVEIAFEWAVKTLARRPLTTKAIEKKLLIRTNNISRVTTVIHRLATCGYLDDRKFIESFISTRLRRGSYSRCKLKRELLTRELPEKLVNEIIEKLVKPELELVQLSMIIERKTKVWSSLANEKKLAKLYNYLLRQGFSEEAIRNQFQHSLNYYGNWEN